MDGKYSIRYKTEKGWVDTYTNSFIEFIWLLITLKKKILFTVRLKW